MTPRKGIGLSFNLFRINMNRANEDYFIEKITDERNVSRTGLELRKMEKDKMDVIMNEGKEVCL